MTITELDHKVMYSHFALVPLNPSGLVDLAPAADPPLELAPEPAVLRTFLQYHQSPLSGSKPASTSQTHTPITSFLLVFYYVCYAPMPQFPLPHHSRLCDLLSTTVETSAFPVTVTMLLLQH